MSFAAESWAWDQRCGDGVAKSVLAYLAFLANRKAGEAWPGMETIIWAVEHGERAVRKAVAKLVKTGKVEREHRFAPNGRCTSTLYRLPVASAPADGQAEAAEPGEKAEPTPANQQGTHPHQSAGVILEPSKNEPRKEERESPPAAPSAPADHPSPSDEILAEAEAADPATAEAVNREIVAAGHDPAELPDERTSWWKPGGRKTALSPDWRPSPADRAYAIQAGLDPDQEAAKMANRACAKGWRMANWSARFRQWCDDEPGWAAKRAVKRNRASENAAWVVESVAIVRAAQCGEAAL